MARKRDYKAEYAAAKKRALVAGYKSEREYKQARKDLGLRGRGVSPLRPTTRRAMYGESGKPSPPKGSNVFVRVRSQIWSDRHSHKDRSRYNPDWSDERVERYYRAYVEEIEGSRRYRSKERKRRLKEWLVPDWMTDAEWTQWY